MIPVNHTKKLHIKKSTTYIMVKHSRKSNKLWTLSKGLPFIPLAEGALVNKIKVKQFKAQIITKMEIKKSRHTGYLGKWNYEKINFSKSTRDFSTHELRRMISLMGESSNMEKLWRFQFASYLDYKFTIIIDLLRDMIEGEKEATWV